MALPFILLGISGSLIAGKYAFQTLSRQPEIRKLMTTLGSIRSIDRTGFESPMTRLEAIKVLNIPLSSMTNNGEINKAHRNLLLSNHPDKGGSTFIASKINQAKEVLLGKKQH